MAKAKTRSKPAAKPAKSTASAKPAKNGAKADYERLVGLQRQLKLLSGASSLLGWDQETYMPSKGTELRADQLALIAGIWHERFVGGELGALLEKCERTEDSLDDAARVNLRETRRAYDRATKLSKELVEEIAKTTSLAQEAWAKARKANDFSAFAPWLEKVLVLKRRVAAAIGRKGQNAYDVLLDEYEPDETTEGLTALFDELEAGVVPLLKRIVASKRKPRSEILVRRYPREKQEAFGRRVAGDMGFDFDAGRLDVSAHPFCSGIVPTDVRITTRYDENDLTGALFGIMHEAGHGLYEQGLDARWLGTPLAEACSTGVHESQSRLWENQVGRSRPFWSHYFPELKKTFADSLRDVNLDDFVFAVNEVKPSLIRTEADEVTYNLHVLLRFQVERDLLSMKLAVSDLPRFWNEKMEELLGITPPTDADGCLQDIHWSLGAFAYFPTYTLGNVYAAQLFAKARAELDLDRKLAKGELRPLREWLLEKVHRRGMFLRPRALIEDVTGKAPSVADFVKYLETKYGELYDL